MNTLIEFTDYLPDSISFEDLQAAADTNQDNSTEFLRQLVRENKFALKQEGKKLFIPGTEERNKLLTYILGTDVLTDEERQKITQELSSNSKDDFESTQLVLTEELLRRAFKAGYEASKKINKK